MTYSEDIELAKRLCEGLKSGNKKAIIEVYDVNHLFFLNFIKTKLYESASYKPEDVFQTFWENLMDGKIFCNYKGNASLRSYLCSILYKTVINYNRKIGKERKKYISNTDIKEVSDKSQKTPEKEISEKEKENKIPLLIQEALLKLSEISSRDEGYIKMRFFEGLEYRDIAVQELGKGANEEEIKTRTEAIRKQVTRPETGSIAKFKIILERIMEREELDINDIFKSE